MIILLLRLRNNLNVIFEVYAHINNAEGSKSLQFKVE